MNAKQGHILREASQIMQQPGFRRSPKWRIGARQTFPSPNRIVSGGRSAVPPHQLKLRLPKPEPALALRQILIAHQQFELKLTEFQRPVAELRDQVFCVAPQPALRLRGIFINCGPVGTSQRRSEIRCFTAAIDCRTTTSRAFSSRTDLGNIRLGEPQNLVFADRLRVGDRLITATTNTELAGHF